jgi:type IV pilus assembly protein PilE
MRARGITLFELLVVIIIVAVLAAVAVPAYLGHIRRVNRTEATTALYGVLAAQERFHLRHGRYAGELDAAPPRGLGLRAVSVAGRYALSVELATDAQSFIARAVATQGGGQAGDDQCREFSIDHRGRRAVAGSGGIADCWR